MSELSVTAMIFGSLLAILYAPFVFFPEKALRTLRGFHRNVWAGRILAAIALIWSGWLFHKTPLPWFEPFKMWLIPIGLVVFVLLIWLMRELLAPRALGGLLLLAPAPLLTAAFQQPSPWRLVVVVLAYVMAVKGLLLALNPYMFRKAVARWATGPRVCRIIGTVGMALGLFVVFLGFTVY